MDENKNKLISPFQFMTILVGTMLGVGALYLPNSLAKISHQDGWISSIIGGLYPLYIVIIGILLSKKTPNEDITALYKKYYGKFLGGLLNFIFMGYFFLFITAVTAGFVNVLRVYIVTFLSPLKIILIAIFAALYLSSKEIKVLGRVNEIIFFLSLFLILIPALGFTKGSIINIKPVFSSGLINIAKGSIESAYAYGGIEIFFLIYPYIDDKEKIKKYSMLAVLTIVIIYTWFTFSTIYYMGPDVAVKSTWALLITTEGITIPIINNFRAVFMFMWSIIIFKTIANNYFVVTSIISKAISSVKRDDIGIYIFPLVVFLTLLYKTVARRRAFLGLIVPWYVIFNILYITVITITVYIKRNDKIEDK